MTYILYNPLANGGNGLVGVSQVQEANREKSPQTLDLTAIDAKAFMEGLAADDEVILCGGDGTLNHLVNELGGFLPAANIYLWRFGTGNDFLRDVLDGERADVSSVRINDHLRDLPRVDVNGKQYLFLNGCSAGVDSLVCEKMNRHRLLTTKKKANYAGTAVEAFFRDYKTVSVRVTVDGESLEFEDVWMAGAMNGRYQGGGMKFAPKQDRNSDRLCFYLWHGTGRVSTLLHFPSIIKGDYTKYTKYCEMRFGREIVIELSEPLYLQLDGETIPDVKCFVVRK